jgi:hypothetical protein
MADDEDRNAGGSEALFQDIARQLEQAGIEHHSPFHIGDVPEFGLSDREMYKRHETTAIVLPRWARSSRRGERCPVPIWRASGNCPALC